MTAKKNNRLSTEGDSQIQNNPFNALDGSNLPKGKPVEKLHIKAETKHGRVEVRREKAGRGGKTVTTLSAFATHHTPNDLDKLLFQLKKSCACGGTIKGRVLELQGNVVEPVLQALKSRGFKPVRAGG